MKKIITFTMVILLTACSQEVPIAVAKTNISSAASNSNSNIESTSSSITTIDLIIADWGPKETLSKENPNPQPDNGMGIWIKPHSTPHFDVAKIQFGEDVVVDAAVRNELITASIPKEQLLQKGTKEIKIIYARGEIIVGNFIIK